MATDDPLGSFLRIHRDRRRLSLKELSLRAGLSEAYYGMVERGQRRPSRETLDKLAGILGLTNDEHTQAYMLLASDVLLDAMEGAPPEVVQAVKAALPRMVAGEPSSSHQADLPEPLQRLHGELWPDMDFEDLAGLPKGYLERHMERIHGYRAQLQALVDHMTRDLADHRKALRAEYEGKKKR